MKTQGVQIYASCSARGWKIYAFNDKLSNAFMRKKLEFSLPIRKIERKRILHAEVIDLS